jgi:tetratricopeptide (TPR) repeat protein
MKPWAALAALAFALAPAFAAAEPRPAPAPPAKKKPPKPEPPTPEKVRADKLFEDGRRYLAAKEYALACTAFEESHAADPAIGTLLNIALCYEEWGKLASAYRAYLEAERYAELKFDERAKGAHRKVDELAPKAPHLQVDVPADADISTVFLFDGKEITRQKLGDDVLVDPGRHEIEARVPGRPPKKTVVELALGERKRITIEVPRPELKVIVTAPPRKKGRLYGGIALTAGGAVAAGTAGFVALLARRDYADAIGGCPELRCETRAAYDATQRARRRATYMTFVGAGGAVLAATGVYLMLTSAGTRSEKRVEILPVHDDGGGIGLALGGRL